VTRFDASTTTRRDVPTLAPELIAAARALPTATLHEAGGKIGALPAALKPVAPGMACAGPALTVHSPPGDNLWLHRGLDVARPGDVLVVYCSGSHEHGYWGEIMATMAIGTRHGRPGDRTAACAMARCWRSSVSPFSPAVWPCVEPERTSARSAGSTTLYGWVT
jgi:hypothetical protein